MAQWKELPPDIDGSERQLLGHLRRLKDHSGLSLAALAGRTGYSRSSWERYLNGKKPVPRRAVEELAQACGTEPTRLIALHEVAERNRAKAPGRRSLPSSPVRTGAREAGQDQEQPQGPTAEPPPRPGRTVRLRGMLLASALAVVVSFGAGLLTARAWEDDAPAVTTGGSAAETGYLRGQTYTCEVHRKDGRLRAGHSDTREMLLDINSTGFDVVETQCLLRAKGFSPGVFDGLYDERTKKAVTDFQRSRHLVTDGIIGPDTWWELRA
ncbi:helix-turn-helix domain-containing protein [Streptomyces sp. NBC_01012]|uniref:helix-turn-helix domain-containing protein n=1 Tax=Streptomyces sp. NBC_01012 TaxID=2903717 RepID=UPI0038709871|nr:helix-turn-helix domain-containing protein [Streptomyces sp. NBC_01012]